MLTFTIISFIAVACAANSGYNYQHVSHFDGDLSFTPGTFSNSQDGGSLSGLVGSGNIGGFNGGIHGGNADNSYNAPAEYQKEFYTFTVPEAEFVDSNADQKIADGIKKGISVIFIKGPENKALENAAISLVKQAGEQKTAIYVLNKQTDIADLANKLNVVNKNNNNKPEVHFVKYRTPEDAANAQKAIKGQYDSLGGDSKSHNGNITPVLNFASKGPVHTIPAQTPKNAYLPTSIFRI